MEDIMEKDTLNGKMEILMKEIGLIIKEVVMVG